MNNRHHMWMIAALALIIGLVEPYVELAWKCRSGFKGSEACVLGREYFRVAQIMTPLILSPMIFIAWLVLSRLTSRK